jgi:hypothetical protein
MVMGGHKDETIAEPNKSPSDGAKDNINIYGVEVVRGHEVRIRTHAI